MGEAKENGWETDRVCEGNGFKFVDGSEFGLETLANGLLSAPNGFAFVAVGNGLAACPATGNGFVEALVPTKPFCCENGLTPVGAGCRGLV